MRDADVEKYAYYVNKLRQNVGLEKWKWSQIVTTQTAHTKYKWPPYNPETIKPHKNFLRTPLRRYAPSCVRIRKIRKSNAPNYGRHHINLKLLTQSRKYSSTFHIDEIPLKSAASQPPLHWLPARNSWILPRLSHR